MRFAKWPRPAAYLETARKRAAFATKQRRERDALPLFADLIAAGQQSVEEEMARRAVWWPNQQQRLRDERAQVWRRARGRLFAFDEARRKVIRRIGRDCPYPADPHSFADLLHQIRIGKIDPDRPPWEHHARVQARTTPHPASFADAFRRIGHRRIEAVPGASPIDVPQYCGNLGNGILFLDMVPPPTEDGAITVRVRGVCTDADIALIGRLASEREQRPAKVVRVDQPQTRAAGFAHRLLILSARYGFRAGDSPIEDYDARLTPDLAERMIAGGMTTRWPRPPSPNKPDNYGSHLGCEIASLAYHGTRPFTDIALVGGGLYLTVMRTFLEGFREMRCVVPDARITEVNAGIGVMRQRLRAWLEEGRGQ